VHRLKSRIAAGLVAALALLASLDHATRYTDDARPLISDCGNAHHGPVVLPISRAPRRCGAPLLKFVLVTVPELLGPAASHARFAPLAIRFVRPTRIGPRGARSPPLV
jgi:hypothetical protein